MGASLYTSTAVDSKVGDSLYTATEVSDDMDIVVCEETATANSEDPDIIHRDCGQLGRLRQSNFNVLSYVLFLKYL